MKKLILLLLAFVIANSSKAQIKTLNNIDELQLTYENFKKKKDTFLINGIFIEYGKPGDYEIMDRLHREGQINKKHFGTAIYFTIFDTDVQYSVPIKTNNEADAKEFMAINNEGKKIQLEIVIFKSAKFARRSHFFLVNKIKVED